MSSVLGLQPVPFQAPYCPSKAALIAFDEALRAELAQEDAGVHVTTVLPPSTNTPFFDHALSKLGGRGKPVPPVYQPEVVAASLVFAAEHPRREIVVGAAGKQLALLGRLAPRHGRFALAVSLYTRLFEHHPVTRPLAAVAMAAGAVAVAARR